MWWSSHNDAYYTNGKSNASANIHYVRINFTWCDSGGGAYSGYTYAYFNDSLQCTSAGGSLSSAGQRWFSASGSASK